MASTYTTNKQIEKPAHNDYVDTWEVPVNNNSGIIDACLGNVTYINMTSRSSYTLTATDLQAANIALYGVLNNATVQVKMTAGVSGSFNIINGTTTAGSSSLLQLAWTSGGNTFDINQSETIPVIADGSTNGPGSTYNWYQGGESYLPASLTLSAASDHTFTQAQTRYKNIILNGAQAGTSFITFPAGVTGGIYAFRCQWTGGGDVRFLGGGGDGTVMLGGTSRGMAFYGNGTGLGWWSIR